MLAFVTPTTPIPANVCVLPECDAYVGKSQMGVRSNGCADGFILHVNRNFLAHCLLSDNWCFYHVAYACLAWNWRCFVFFPNCNVGNYISLWYHADITWVTKLNWLMRSWLVCVWLISNNQACLSKVGFRFCLKILLLSQSKTTEALVVCMNTSQY